MVQCHPADQIHWVYTRSIRRIEYTVPIQEAFDGSNTLCIRRIKYTVSNPMDQIQFVYHEASVGTNTVSRNEASDGLDTHCVSTGELIIQWMKY